MTGSEAYYSVIQYCPDRFRAEAVNVGVVLFAPHSHSITARMTTNHARVRKMFGTSGRALESLKLAKRAMEGRFNSSTAQIKTFEDLRSFIATRANDLRMIEPRLVKATDVKSDLERLYFELVEEQPEKQALEATESTEVFPPKLREMFLRLLAENRAWEPGNVSVPILKRKLAIPYAYQNGAVNLVKPFVFQGGKRAETQAANLAIDGDLIRRHRIKDTPHRLIIVSTQEDETVAHELNEHVQPLFAEYKVRLVRSAQTEAFAREVEMQAH